VTARIRKGDLVAVRAGDDAGKRGRVLRVLPDAGRAVVEGVNVSFKHLKRSPKNPRGGRIEKESPVALSKLMLVDPTTDRPTRVGTRVEDGKKRRYAVGSGALLDVERRTKRAKGEKGEEKPEKAEKAEKGPKAEAEKAPARRGRASGAKEGG
jgi:large subunit ribosomal protein L24